VRTRRRWNGSGGNSGELGNELADETATGAVEQNTPQWKADLSTQQDFTITASCHGQQLESLLRQFLKQQTTIRHHQTWTAQKRVKRSISDLEDVEWRSALSILHDKRPLLMFYISRGDTTCRSQHIKKLHGMLPTLTVMQVRHPNLYLDNFCCLCREAPENNDHVWVCPKSFKQQS